MTLIAFSVFAFSSSASLIADGLIKKIPKDGPWATYAVETTITHEDGSQTSSNGTLTVRSVGTTIIDDTTCRWLEFELSWQQEVTVKIPRGFHSSVTKIAIPESAFLKNADSAQEIRAGFSAKTSSDVKRKEWNYPRVREVVAGRGSSSGYGVLDQYVRAPFGQATQIADKTIEVGGKAFNCSGLEHSETTHKLGASRNTVTTTDFRQWANDKTPFGTVRYHFERLRMNGEGFSQELTLEATGSNAKTSLPSVK